MKASRGVLYQATGQKRYLAICACSVRSLRASGYNGAVRVLVDDDTVPTSLFEGLDVEIFDVQVPGEPRMPSRWVKTQLHRFTPWDTTLFLDCDVIVLNDFASLWAHVEAEQSTELAIAPCLFPIKNSVGVLDEEIAYTIAQGVTGVQWNSGVMLWRKSAASDAFFENWHREWTMWSDNDQLAMMRALRKNPLNMVRLGKKWNHLLGDSATFLKEQGVVFWHPAGGRDTDVFRQTFGAVLEQQAAALGLSGNDFQTAYHAEIKRKTDVLKRKHRVLVGAYKLVNRLRVWNHKRRHPHRRERDFQRP